MAHDTTSAIKEVDDAGSVGEASEAEPGSVGTEPVLYTRFRVRFESAEHAFIGDGAQLQFETGAVLAGTRPLFAGASSMGGQEPKHLTYGRVVALGGDFYGVPSAPISTSPDPIAAFRRAYQTLENAPNTEVKKILEIMDKEIAAVRAARAAGKSPSSAYEALGDELSYEWNIATGGQFGLDPRGRYLALAAVNWDHFGDHAVTCYRAGHSVALNFAAGIKKSNRTEDQKVAALELAYAMNAFADHFLTDLFSAGHLRTPRKELYDQSSPQFVGSLLARCMHDEDSEYGLDVENHRGDHWKAYGDKRLLDQPDADNLRIVKDAVQASVDEVWEAYEASTPPTAMGALALTPHLPYASFAALFITDAEQAGGKVLCRMNLADRFNYAWTPDWWATTTLLKLKALGWLKD